MRSLAILAGACGILLNGGGFIALVILFWKPKKILDWTRFLLTAASLLLTVFACSMVLMSAWICGVC